MEVARRSGADPYRSEEDLLQDSETDSFWDIGNYKRVVRRMEDGARLCADFAKMAAERAEIEAKHSRHLAAWARKWEDLVARGPESGSLEAGWRGALTEAARLSEVHARVHARIQEDIAESMHDWKTCHYHRHLMHIKECKRAEEGFAQAQKPWAKRMGKNRRARKAYHAAARELELQTAALRQIENSRECTSEQVGKGRERKERAQRELDRSLNKYRERLEDLQHYRGRYVEDMSAQFARCQDFEQKRMEHFRTTLVTLKKVSDISQDQR